MFNRTYYLAMKYTAVPRTKIVSMMNIAITGSGNEVNFCFISFNLETISVNSLSIPLPELCFDISPPGKRKPIDFTGKSFTLSVMLSKLKTLTTKV